MSGFRTGPDHMDQIEHPPEALWNSRRAWFEDLFDIERRGGGYAVGEHSTGLLVDLQAAFCAGAFIATIVVACSVVDAHLREVELEGEFRGGFKAAFSGSTLAEELEWLRLRRNVLVHAKSGTPAISVDLHWTHREQHEQDARRAVEVLASALFEHPCV